MKFSFSQLMALLFSAAWLIAGNTTASVIWLAAYVIMIDREHFKEGKHNE